MNLTVASYGVSGQLHYSCAASREELDLTLIKDYERVVLTTDLPEHHLKAGDIGVVVMTRGDHEGYELEIFSADGHTLDVITVEADQVRPVSRRDVLHVRAMPESL